MSKNPSSWGAYRRLISSGDLAKSPGLNRFAARYSMALQLTDVVFDGLSKASRDGYTAGLRVGLAYSALEALEKAIDKNVGGTQVVAPAVADRIRDRRHASLHTLLMAPDPNGKTLTARMERLLSETDYVDVRPAAQKMRHLVFHGVYTPHAAGAGKSVSLRALINDLAGEVMTAADLRFTSWVHSEQQ